MTHRHGACAWLLALLLYSAPATAQQPDPGAQTDPATPLVVVLNVNGVARGEFFVFRASSGVWLVREEDIAELGLRLDRPATLAIEGTRHVALNAVPGLDLRLDEASMTLHLTAAPALLPRSQLSNDPRGRTLPLSPGQGAFVNWAAEHTSGRGNGLSFATEAGLRSGPLLLIAQGNTVRKPDGDTAFVRLRTTATYDRYEQHQRVTVGDLFSRSSVLGSVTSLGGIALSSLEGTDPYAIRYPLGTVRGQAVLPSELEVYVDGQRVRTERVNPGEFDLGELFSGQGARAVRLVVRDPFGREEQFDYAFYISDQLLRPGLHEYQYAAGWLRRGYGQDSLRYGPAAASAYHRWGWTDAVTLGLRANARRGVFNGGPLGTVRLGTAGMLSGSLAVSRAEGLGGHAVALRYDYNARRWGTGVAMRWDSPDHVSFNDPPSVSNLRSDGYVYINRQLGSAGHVWFSRSAQTVRQSPTSGAAPPGISRATLSPRSVSTIGYASGLPRINGIWRMNLSRVADARGHRNEFSIGLTLVLDGRNLVAAGARAGGAGSGQSLQWSRSPARDDGWRLNLSADRDGASGHAPAWRGDAQFDGSLARLRGEYVRPAGGGTDQFRLAASGAAVWLDGQLRFGRPVADAFALVKVGQLAGVEVTANGTPVGVTDGQGLLFVPRVSSYYETRFAIDPRHIPIDWRVPRLERRARLPERAGAVIDFEAKALRALVARLVVPGAQGLQPLARATVQLTGPQGEHETDTGLQGELYLEDLPPGPHAGQAVADGIRCNFRLDVPADGEPLVDAGDLRCEPL